MRWASSPERGFVLRGGGRRPVGEPFVHPLRVRYGECDAQGVVFNAHYLAYFDNTITELWRAAFGSYQVMLDRGVDIVVAEAQLRFRGGGALRRGADDRGAVAHLGHHQPHAPPTASCATAELLLEATCATCSSTAGTVEKTPIPDWARAGLDALDRSTGGVAAERREPLA